MFALSIVKALKTKGYTNITISPGVWTRGGTIWVDSPEKTFEEQKKFLFTNQEGTIHVDLPLH